MFTLKVVVQKAHSKVPKSVWYRRLVQLGKKYTPVIQIGLLKGIQKFKSRVTREQLYAAFQKGSFHGVMETIPWDQLPGDLSEPVTKLHRAGFEAGLISTKSLPAPKNFKLRWDMTNPNLQRYIETKTASLVTRISEDSRNSIRDAVARSFNRALTPRQVANDLHGSIGLFPKWEKAVNNYQNGLVLAGKFKPERIEKLTEAYRERLLKSRSMMIARTETRRATNFGQLAVWREGASQGLIERHKSRRVYIVDGSPCDICEPMDGETIGLDDVWVFPDGDTADVAGDVHPNCMCTETLELD